MTAEAVALLCEPTVAQIARRAPFAYVAVETGRGPHVTPVLIALTTDRLWFAVPRGTVKARALSRRPEVGVMIPGEPSAVVIGGIASALDAGRPADLAARLGEIARAPVAVPSYGLRNASELFGFARDAATTPGGSPPSELVLVSVRPRLIELVPAAVDAGEGAGVRTPDTLKTALAQLPGELGDHVLRPGPSVLGWSTADGPLAVPARWDGARARVRWPMLAGAPAPAAAAACLCFDTRHGLGPNAKEGLLLRGGGRVSGRGGTRSISLALDRVTYWRGFETGTIAAAP